MKISVITATWHCVETIGDRLASVAGQSYPDLEHILIDGGSRDGTLDVLQAHRDRLAVLVSEPDGGIYDALNTGLARATGEVVGLLHADDVYADGDVLVRVAGPLRIRRWRRSTATWCTWRGRIPGGWFLSAR